MINKDLASELYESGAPLIQLYAATDAYRDVLLRLISVITTTEPGNVADATTQDNELRLLEETIILRDKWMTSKP